MDTVLALRAGSSKFRRIAVAEFDARIHTLAPGETLPLTVEAEELPEAEAEPEAPSRKWRKGKK